MQDTETTVFTVRPAPVYLAGVILLAVLVAGVTTWFFRGGMYTAGVVMLVMFVPLLGLFWYTIYVAPQSARIEVGPGAVLVNAPPFFKLAVEAGDVQRAYVSDLDTDAHLARGERKKGIRFGTYRSESYLNESGREVVLLANTRDVICLVTANRLVALGVPDLDGLRQALGQSAGISV